MNMLISLFMGGIIGVVLWGLAHTLPRFAVNPPENLPKNPFGKLSIILPMLTASVFMYAEWFIIDPAQQLLFLILCCFLLLVALIDFYYRLVLNILIYPAIAVLLIFHLIQPASFLPMLLGGLLSGGIFGLTTWLRPGELGGGDVKLATLLGILFGFPGVLWVLLVGAGSGGVIAIGLLSQGGNAQRTFPYAPFLCGGALLVLFIQPTMLWG